MKLVIFGSTGSVGRRLVPEALAIGHQVRAFTRNPGKLDEFSHENLTAFKGDVLDYKAVEEAVKGQDAVLCTLGAGRKGIVRAEGTKNIIKAMEKLNISRFICQTTLGAGESRGNLNFFWKYIMSGFLLKEAFKDHELQEKYIKESRLDWTIVRPAAFTDGRATGNYRHGFDPDEKNLELKISRADVALFMLMQLMTNQYHRKAAGLSY